MDFRPATQASRGRHLLRSAIAEAVASDPAQRVVASIAAPGWRSRTPIWVGLGAVVALTVAEAYPDRRSAAPAQRSDGR